MLAMMGRPVRRQGTDIKSWQTEGTHMGILTPPRWNFQERLPSCKLFKLSEG